jgi:hypothetical protein
MMRGPLLVAAVLALASCSDDGISPTTNRAPDILSIVVTPDTLVVGETASVVITASDADGDAMMASAVASHGTVRLEAPVDETGAAGTAGQRRMRWHGTFTAISAGEDQTRVTVGDGHSSSMGLASAPRVVASAAPSPTPAPPTVRLEAVGDWRCHAHPDERYTCRLEYTATATDYNTIGWGGCCAGSSGTTGTCAVTALGANNTCQVEVAGRGGSASASAVATGQNDRPRLDFLGPWPPLSCGAEATFSFRVVDDQLKGSVPSSQRGGGRGWVSGTRCAFVRTTVDNAAADGYVDLHVTVRVTSGPYGEYCIAEAAWTDPWDESGRNSAGNPPPACP